ncbi:MAG TPA: thiamine biosynthesis protein ThiS [Cyanobacteria bacterium UBA9579]|nr:thiamine biosynthesis protein ThiS [Cyanobacteria bacterium UBA9579]
MKIILNGEEKEVNEKSTVKEILGILKLKSPMLVVEKNLEIVQKDQYENCYLQDGDKIEVVSFFGGG